MRIRIWKSLFALPLLAASCAGEPVSDGKPSGTINVSVGSGPRIEIEASSAGTRTELGDDGVSVKWSTNDRIAIWAVDSQGTAQLDAQPFRMWHYNATFGDAKFTSDITPMPEDTYTYYAVYPAPASHSGTQASYNIPSTQNGEFNGAYDIMTAAAVEGPALQSGDNSDAINFTFSHKVHVLKITIPTNNLGEKISELELTFPSPVTGVLTVDAANPDADPVLSDGSNVLTLIFDEPVDAGAVVYAMIAPTVVELYDQVAIKAIGTTGESTESYMAGKTYAAGHTTPIRYNVPSMGARFTLLNFSLAGDGTSTLGEKVTSVTLTAPAGSTFDNGSNVRTFTPDDDNKYTITCRTNWTNNLSGKAITVSYESENAIVSNSITMPAITTGTSNTIATFTVPYLMSEDFSGITAFTGPDSSNANELTGNKLPGWYTVRTNGTAATAVTIRSKYNAGLWGLGASTDQARFNSCPLSGIKAGKNVRVKVVFNGEFKKNKCNVSLNVGRTSDKTTLDGEISDMTNIPLSSNSSASITNIPTVRTVYIPNFDSAQSIAWKTAASGSGSSSGSDDIFIDNIKVSIANE